MSRVILLDSGPLGLLTAPPGKPGPATDYARWPADRLAAGDRALIPEITDYETRRELVRANKSKVVRRLDALASAVGFLPLTTVVMRQAADLWATARRTGQPTAGHDTPRSRCDPLRPGVGRGTGGRHRHPNVGHLARFAPAAVWPTLI